MLGVIILALIQEVSGMIKSPPSSAAGPPMSEEENNCFSNLSANTLNSRDLSDFFQQYHMTEGDGG